MVIERPDDPLVSKTERVKGGFRSLKEGLSDTSDASTQLILWLYSIEPPFYKWVGEASRDINVFESDPEHVNSLGPFARALFLIFYGAEGNRDDKLKIGMMQHKPSMNRIDKLGFFNSSYLVFKATYMESEWILDWKMCFGLTGLKNPTNGKIDLLRRDKPAYMNLPGHVSAYQNLESALKFAYCKDETLKLVLFVILIQNQNKYPCFRMNKPCFSAYPNESEIIL